MYQEDDELTISLTDMLAYFLHHWKMVLIVMIIFMVMVGGFMSYRDYSGIKSKYEDSTYSAMIEDLTDEQIETVTQFYNRYISYKNRIIDSQFYMDNSLKMRLDANNISVYTKEYVIKSDYSGIMSSFQNAALDLDDYTEMAEALGGDVDPRYVDELIDLWGNAEQGAYDIDTDKVGDVINGSIGNSYTGILCLTVTANGRENCEKLAAIADIAIADHFKKLLASGVDVEMKELTSSYIEKVDTDLAEYQRSKVEEGSNLVTSYYNFETSAKSSLDDDELALFQYLIEKAQNVTDHVHWKKWCVVGGAIGILLALGCLFVGYLAIPGIKTVEDAFLITKEKEMAIVIQSPKSKIFIGKIFHNWAQRAEFHGIKQIPDTESIPLVCDRIAQVCTGKNAKSVFLICDTEDGYTDEVESKCLGFLKKFGLTAYVGNPSASLKAIQELRKSDAAVLVLTNKGSLLDSIRSNMVICGENNVPIIGNFIVHPQR